jgi:hypothetical protein
VGISPRPSLSWVVGKHTQADLPDDEGAEGADDDEKT